MPWHEWDCRVLAVAARAARAGSSHLRGRLAEVLHRRLAPGAGRPGRSLARLARRRHRGRARRRAPHPGSRRRGDGAGGPGGGGHPPRASERSVESRVGGGPVRSGCATRSTSCSWPPCSTASSSCFAARARCRCWPGWAGSWWRRSSPRRLELFSSSWILENFWSVLGAGSRRLVPAGAPSGASPRSGRARSSRPCSGPRGAAGPRDRRRGQGRGVARRQADGAPHRARAHHRAPALRRARRAAGRASSPPISS